MARYTIREFTDAIGLGKDRDSVTRSGIILKALCGLGIAKESGLKQGTTGRPSVVYEVPDPIVIPLVGLQKPVAKQDAPVEVVVPATLPRPPVASQTAPVAPVVIQAASAGPQFHWGDDEDDD
jgi:hypothetical protein